MKMSAFRRYAISTCVAAAMLAGCGGSQPPIGASTEFAHQSSDKASGSFGDLIYAAGGCGGACILAYPDGSLVGKANITGLVKGDCSDETGNVFITNDTQILEYAHGGTSPVATLALPGDDATGCAVDRTTGSLAVTFSGSDANIAIFPDAQGTPTLLSSHIISQYCGYDGAGNLFVSGYYNQEPQLSELPYSSSNFLVLSISPTVGAEGQVQWDGKYVTFEGRSSRKIKISRLAISGSNATVVGTTHFRGGLVTVYQSWIYGNRVLIPYSIRGQRTNKIGLWVYPKGGKPVTKFGNFGQGKFATFSGVTISLAP